MRKTALLAASLLASLPPANGGPTVVDDDRTSPSQRAGTTRIGFGFGHIGAAHFAASLIFCELTAQQILGGCGIFPKDGVHVLVVEIPEDKAEALSPIFEGLAQKAAENFSGTLAARRAEVEKSAAPRVVLSS